MKTFSVTCFALILYFAAPAQTFTQLLENGKDLIKKERGDKASDKGNYLRAAITLEAALQIKPDDPEAHYFLGSAYDYENNADCGEIINTRKGLAIASSNEFETVIRLQPNYTGEIIALDPVSKLYSIWGCLGFCYMVKGYEDSARWAFAEGKKRGAFGDFSLTYYRKLLHDCAPHAIYISYGDFSIMNIWYLQAVEHYRTDVTAMNLNMLYIPWVTEYYYKHDSSLFSSQQVASDTTKYEEWEEQEVAIPIQSTGKKLKVPIKPTYYDRYLVRNDMVLLDMVQHNKFMRPLYFEKGSAPEAILMLNHYTADRFIMDELVPKERPSPDKAFYDQFSIFPFQLINTVNPHCSEDVRNVRGLRYEFIKAVYQLLAENKKADARKLLAQMEQYIPVSQYSYEDPALEGYVTDFHAKVK